MTRIEKHTVYKCNGCGTESAHPDKWITFGRPPINNITIGTIIIGSEDYCESCAEKMRAAIKPVTKELPCPVCGLPWDTYLRCNRPDCHDGRAPRYE